MSDQETTNIEPKNLTAVPLGWKGTAKNGEVVSYPYPMNRHFTTSEGKRESELGVLESNVDAGEKPLLIHTNRSPDEVTGLAWRDMPSPGMLDMFKDGLEKRQLIKCSTEENPYGYKPKYARRVEFMMGEPGTGKSFLAGLHAKMRDPRGAILVDCGGRNLNDLLYVTKLDHEAGKTVFSAIDEKLANGEMDKGAISLLKKGLGDAFTHDEDTGRYAIDWEKLEGQKDDVTAQLGVIEKVAGMAGIDSSKSAFGITVEEGALIRAWRENRPPILDEYNKAKPGTDDQLQILWQVFNGEMSEHTVNGPGGKSFTFKASEMPPNFFVTLTGNLTKDGYSTRSLSASAYQRLQPEYIDPPAVEDWQHRICQKLTGLPVSTIYNASEGYWKDHKDEFTDWLIDKRREGLSEDQVANIPSWQFEMLKNWDRVLQASEQLAGFYDKWAQVVDPNSELMKEAEKGSNAEAARVMHEIDEKYAAEIGVGLRLALEHMNDATHEKADAIKTHESQGVSSGPTSPEDWPDFEDMPGEAVEKRFGTRLENIILDDINAKSNGREQLLNYLLRRSAEAGLMEMILEEGKRAGQDNRISGLLDLDPELQKQIPEDIEAAHTLICDYLRSKYDIDPDVDNTQVVSPTQLERVLTQLGERRDIERASERSGVLYLPTIDMDEMDEHVLSPSVATESRMGTPKGGPDSLPEDRRAIYDRIREQEEGLEGIYSNLPLEETVDAERMLVGFAIPKVGQQNMEALWSEFAIDCSQMTETDSVQKIMVNQSETGIATNLVKCKTLGEDGEERPEYLYIVRDTFGEGNTLVTGSVEITDALKDALAKSNITYVNRSDEGAEAIIEEKVKEIFDGKSDVKNSGMPIERSAIEALSHRIPWDGPDETLLFELPNQEKLHPNYFSKAITDEERGLYRETLVALLSDREQYLEKSEDWSYPIVATTSPDLDKLKHTLRHLLAEQEPDKAAGQGM